MAAQHCSHLSQAFALLSSGVPALSREIQVLPPACDISLQHPGGGAKFPYHGHVVVSEWQLMQARLRMALA